MIKRCLNIFYGGLQQNLHHQHQYFGVPDVNRGEAGKMRVDTPESCYTVCLIFGREGMWLLSGIESGIVK